MTERHAVRVRVTLCGGGYEERKEVTEKHGIKDIVTGVRDRVTGSERRIDIHTEGLGDIKRLY